MSTTPAYQYQPPPSPQDTTSTQQDYPSSSAHGSVGPVIGVLAVITVLGVIAGMIGRICSGKPVMGYGGHYDLEGWIETKCASCIDGRVGPPPRPNRPAEDMGMAGRGQPRSEEVSGEIKEGGQVGGGEDRQEHDKVAEEEHQEEEEEEEDDDEEEEEEEEGEEEV